MNEKGDATSTTNKELMNDNVDNGDGSGIRRANEANNGEEDTDTAVEE